jgi:protein O-mannosyl-transferase
LLVAGALGLLALLAYSNSFSSGFVVDNHYIILRDPRIQQVTSQNVGLIFDKTYWWPTQETGLYRPFTTLTYLFNYAVLGNSQFPAGYHWINFLLHFSNTMLVYALALRLMRKSWPAILMAALWAVHPILTESVTNIIGRADLLAAFATLSGLLMYLKSTDCDDWKRYAWLCGLMAVTILGVFSKESAVAILGVIVLYEITFWKERKQIRGLALGCAAVSIPLLIMLYQRARVLAAASPAHFGFVDNPLQGASFIQSRLTAIAVMARYMWLLVWPAKLSADYSYSQIALAQGTFYDCIAWIVVAAVIVTIALQFRRNPLVFFFGTFALVTFVPTANLLFLTGTIMAERLMYLPSVGFCACAVIALYAIGERFQLRMLAPVALCAVIAGFAVRTWERNFDWHDILALSIASVRTAPHSYKTHLGLANSLDEADPTHANISDVLNEMNKSLAIIDPLPDSLNVSSPYATAGALYLQKGDLLVRKGAEGKTEVPPESLAAYQESLRILKRAVVLDQVTTEADRRAKLARGTPESKLSPTGLPVIYTTLANTYLRLGDNQHAYEAAMHARLLNPGVLESYVLMSKALAPSGHKEEAALALVEGLIVSGDKRLLGPLSVLYKYGVDPEGCAITHTENDMLLNEKCAPVHKELCSATSELIQLYRVNLREDLAEPAKVRALGEFGCPASQFQ